MQNRLKAIPAIFPFPIIKQNNIYFWQLHFTSGITKCAISKPDNLFLITVANEDNTDFTPNLKYQDVLYGSQATFKKETALEIRMDSNGKRVPVAMGNASEHLTDLP